MEIIIDAEFKRLIPALLPDEFKQLETNILRDGCKEPLSVWKNGQNILIDGHNRHKICEKHSLKFETVSIDLADRDHAKVWIGERQLGRRNLDPDKKAIIANEVREWRKEIAGKRSLENLKQGTKVPERVKSAHSGRTSTAVAKEFKIPERKIRIAQEIKKADVKLPEMVRSGEVTLVEAKKISVLPAQARTIAIKAVESGTDVRAAIREAKKEDYNEKIAVAAPKKLEGTYRIIYADPPWKYIGLNQADEYGHAERHYDCLDDEQLKKYKPGKGSRLVRDLTDKNAVLFLWVTSPLLERCFSILESWGFEYKSSFVWDKVKHNMGHYNSVRHELLLVCTKGSCKPDVPKLVDSVQSIERTKHSEKPEEFRKIIENLYDHGRKLELFRRGDAPAGWDVDGNES